MESQLQIRNEWKSICSVEDAQLVLTSYAPNVQVGVHSHQFHLVGMLIFGDMTESVDGKCRYLGRAFDFGVQPRLARHTNQIGPLGLRSLMIVFDQKFAERLGVSLQWLRRYQWVQNKSVARLGTEMYRRAISGRVDPDEFCEFSQTLFHELERNFEFATASRPRWIDQKKLSQMDDVSKLKVSQLARKASKTEAYYSRSFSKHHGECFRDFKQRKLVCDAARVLVNSSDSISSVAQKCGFSDQPHMTRQFSRFLGMTPRKLRMIAQEKI